MRPDVHFGLWLLSRGAKQEEFRHVRVERYRQFVPDRGCVADVVRQQAIATKGSCAFVGVEHQRIGVRVE
ncbi:msl0377 [Mesorhizobium japonicum MAFF 303099]|uniref:Msl0377 protein n=1 Tax=Mesorhizobium japonicum (strain LMG 29417 / CECT 9101 / MAFF 303099) TaxID=266835 RepID=Q98MZ4_RHILO|nr:msl0377 [Mesorhizobium japonicum MAFF 303099]